MVDLETQIASFSILRDQHCVEITNQKRELYRLRKVMANHHSKNARLRRLAQDLDHACDVAITDRDLSVAVRDKLLAHLTQLASSVSFTVASTPFSSDNKRRRSDISSGIPSKRSRASGASSPMTRQIFNAICTLDNCFWVYAISSSHAIS